MRLNRKNIIAVDTTIYAIGNLVERCFNRLKNARRIATRCGKTAVSFLGFLDVVAVRLWFRHLPTGPDPYVSPICYVAPDPVLGEGPDRDGVWRLSLVALTLGDHVF